METTRICKECRQPLPADAPEGLCPACLAKVALGTEPAAAGATLKLDLSEAADEAVGQTLGRYKLLEKIGEGGCGVVYVAEQTEPVRRRVALKVIKLGMDTKAVVARFEAERQALAMMDHPNIARVLDAGATETGRPFFVMELVRGIRITDYCDQANLSTQERLDLFIKVCQAIQHAHQKGIIHRDIKPSNILVTLHDGVPVPKVIDFGIAKATEGRLTDATVYTQLHQFIGTPAYMSPEQAEMSGLDIDTRSDIYSLGVLLYELLAGSTPFDANSLMAQGIDAMRKTIREREPVRPSTRLATLQGEALTTTARHRSSEAPKLIHLLKGDLDWIVMKCLEKDRTRRYETANGLASDLNRHLENEPVVARPPSTAYRLQKAWRRHKTAFAMAGLIATVLVAATGISIWQAIRATRAETLAKQHLAESEAISQFLTEVFQSPNPARGRTITAAEILDFAARKLETDLTNQPARRAKLQATLGRTYFALGLSHEAIPLQEKVRDYHLAASGPEHPETLTAKSRLAGSYYMAGRRDEALKLREEVLALRRKVLGPEHPDTLAAMGNLGISYDGAGRRDEALRLREETLALSRKLLGPEHPETLRSMRNLGISYEEAGRQDEAFKIWVEVLALRRKVLGPEHPETLMSMRNLANSYDEAGRRDEALKLREEVLALRRKVLGPEHPDTITAMGNLESSYDEASRHDEALKLGEEALALSRKVLGPEHPDTFTEMKSLAVSYDDAGRRDEALQMREETLALSRKVLGPEHPDTLLAMRDLAISHVETGHHQEAVALLEKACEADPKDTDAALTLATFQTWFGQDADYEATRRRLIQQVEGTVQAGTAERCARAVCLRPSTDTALLAKTLELARRGVELGKNSGLLPGYQLGLGLAEYRNGQFADAEQTLALAEQKVGEHSEIQGVARLFRAMSLFQQKRPEEARKLFSLAETEIPPLPKDESKPRVDGRAVSREALICWLAYKEARSLLNESGRAKQ